MQYLYYNPLFVCLYVCVYVSQQTPPRPFDKFTSFFWKREMLYPANTLSTFHDLHSKVKVMTEVKVIDFFLSLRNLMNCPENGKLYFHKFHTNFMKNFTLVAGFMSTQHRAVSDKRGNSTDCASDQYFNDVIFCFSQAKA